MPLITPAIFDLIKQKQLKTARNLVARCETWWKYGLDVDSPALELVLKNFLKQVSIGEYVHRSIVYNMQKLEFTWDTSCDLQCFLSVTNTDQEIIAWFIYNGVDVTDDDPSDYESAELLQVLGLYYVTLHDLINMGKRSVIMIPLYLIDHICK